MPFLTVAFLEALGKRTQVHLMGPCRRVLRRKIKIGLCDRARIHTPGGWKSKTLVCLPFVDQSVDHDMRDVNAFRAIFARQRLCKSAQREFG